jgi:hypothetical protein
MTKIVEMTDNTFYMVEEMKDPSLAHCYLGIAVKKVRGAWEPKAKAKWGQLVSKAHVLGVVDTLAWTRKTFNANGDVIAIRMATAA